MVIKAHVNSTAVAESCFQPGGSSGARCGWSSGIGQPPDSPFFCQRLKFLFRGEGARLCRCTRHVLPWFCTEIKECTKFRDVALPQQSPRVDAVLSTTA